MLVALGVDELAEEDRGVIGVLPAAEPARARPDARRQGGDRPRGARGPGGGRRKCRRRGRDRLARHGRRRPDRGYRLALCRGRRPLRPRPLTNLRDRRPFTGRVPRMLGELSAVRVGVIGVNGIGQAHLWALRTGETATLAAVCDVDATRAEKAGADHEVPSFTDARAMGASGVCDAVVVATPPGTHGELVRGALDAGLHVYCEKPFTPTCDEGYALAQHAVACQRVLVVGLQFRFHLGYAAMRDGTRRSRPTPACARHRDELAARAAVLRREPLARDLAHGGRGSAHEPGGPPTRRAHRGGGDAGARACPGAQHLAPGRGRGRRDHRARMAVRRAWHRWSRR